MLDQKAQERNGTPKAIAVIPGNIPDIKDIPHWVNWRYEWRLDKQGKGEWAKVPYTPHRDIGGFQTGLQRASTTDPATWGTFDDAVEGLSVYPGIGVCLQAPYCGVDVDKCRDPLTGELTPFALDVIRRLDSYTEVSPSGKGIRILVLGQVPRVNGKTRNRDDAKGIEIYDASRYLTMTGHRIDKTPHEIKERQAELTALHGEIFGVPEQRPQQPQADRQAPALDDQHVIDRASSAANGDKFGKLWRGDWQGDYPSQSNADLALCALLAFYTQDPAQLDRLFRSSGLYRGKWDRDDYRDRTIDKAISELTTTYGANDDRLTPQQTNAADHIVSPVDKEPVSPFAAAPAESTLHSGGTNDVADIASRVLGEKLKPKLPEAIRFESWDETCDIAAQQREDWLIPHWAEFGCLHILTGLPFSGKSYLISDLIGCICTGRDFCDMPIQQVPFIIFDFENKERILVKRIKASLANDPGRVRELYHRLPPARVPRPLTHDFIRNAIGQLKAKMAGSKGVLIIDTLRSAFAGSGLRENENDDMAGLLYPLQTLAQETGWCIILLHHNTKAANHYSGAGVIAGAADYLWNWISDKQKLTARLEMDGGRDDHQFPLEFRFDMDSQRNVFLGTQKDIKQREEEVKVSDWLGKWMTLLPEDGGASVAELIPLALGAGLLAPDHSRKTHERNTRQAMQDALDRQFVTGTGNGSKGDPVRYMLADPGRTARLGLGTLGTIRDNVPNGGQSQ